MDSESVRTLLNEAFERAKQLEDRRLPLRGYQAGILSYENGFEELEFVEP